MVHKVTEGSFTFFRSRRQSFVVIHQLADMASQASVSISQAGPSEECLTPSAAHPKFGSFAVADRLRDEAVEEGFHPSPIPTPYHTRAGSEEAGGNVRPHSKEQAETFVAKIEERAAEGIKPNPVPCKL